MASLFKIAMPWLALPLFLSTSLATGVAQAHHRGDRFEHRLDVRGERIAARHYHRHHHHHFHHHRCH